MKAQIESDELVIRLPLETPRPSSSGKTLIVASSHGNAVTAATIDGRNVVVSCNAYVYATPKRSDVVRAELADAPAGRAA